MRILPTTFMPYMRQLEQDLKAGALKGGPEDSVVVLRVLEVYLEPMQEEMLKVAPLMQLAGREARERVKLLPLIMKVIEPVCSCFADTCSFLVVGSRLRIFLAAGMLSCQPLPFSYPGPWRALLSNDLPLLSTFRNW